MSDVGIAGERPNLAWIVHQYGPGVGGGSETLCRHIAGLLVDDVDSTVLTSAARTYGDWEPSYPLGESFDNGVRVLRFPANPVDADLRALYEAAFASPGSPELGRRWLLANGPTLPGLIEHLRDEGTAYDAVCAVPYVYPTTLLGLETFAGPRILLPCAHDEPALRLSLYDSVFRSADVLVFNSEEERDLVEQRFGMNDRASSVIGTFVDPSPAVDPTAFAARYDVVGPYVVCVGRIDYSKGSDLLFALHAETVDRTPTHTLVMVGHSYMDTPAHPNLRVTGYVDERTKHEAIAGAAAVIVPSPYESLSIVALEGWSHGKPALVNAASAVLLGQCQRSGGGLWYRDAHEYAHGLTLLLSEPSLARGLGRAGQSWAFERYARPRVRAAWLDVLQTAVEQAARRTPPAVLTNR
jgi:glycosyltransferase involved in cell wall biosynthesis